MESMSQTEASVRRVLDLGPEIICPGHGRPLPASKIRIKKTALKPLVGAKKKEEEEDLEELASGLF
jgi:glyoxylase-like metal-dependent hydrolase (beta-lactamase superfamily II)